ncbi:FRG domain-containing protein [Desemzia sp. FAM 23989]|uniref:FRG domain-containing protein n=1 Tax=Desemzia sp. FAM 23989 TaxID=3259523 RepID=UPI00388AF6E5
MEVIDEQTAFSKLIEEAEKNGLVCIEDFFSLYEVRRQQSTHEKVDTENFIEHPCRNCEIVLKEKKLNLFTTNNIIEKNKQTLDTKVETEKYIHDILEKNQKHYLINQDIEARIILNPYTFLQKLHEEIKKIKEKAICELNEESKNFKNAFSLSKDYKQQHKIQSTIKACSDFQKRKDLFFYRGHSSVNYSLLPSIHRNGLEKYESQMNDQLISTSNQDFLNVHRHVDILRKMQHYRMPTRLIDITSNPLVALYFAISGNPHLDGEFIRFDTQQNNVKTNNSDTVEIISALAAIDAEKKQELFTLSKEFSNKFSASNDNKKDVIAEFNQKDSVKYLLHEIRSTVGDFEPVIDPRHLTQAFFVSTHIDNARISNQNGSFIITSLYDMEKDSLDSSPNGIKSSIEQYRAKHHEKVIRYIIPSALKEIIKLELAHLGINDHHIYPDLEHAATYIKAQYSE